MCSHLQKKLLEDDGIYHGLWTSMQEDPELTAVVRSRQLHIYRNGKKVLLLVDGILKFQTLVDYFGSYALVEITLLLLVILPTVAVYIFTKE